MESLSNRLFERIGDRYPRLDLIRSIAIILMVVDHGLLFFLPNSPETFIVRATLTRCAEPLFIFVIASLAISLGRPAKIRRWIQIVLVSIVTSMILSNRLGYAMADVLVSIAVVVPLIPMLTRLSARTRAVVVYVSAGLALVPLSFVGFAIDYSPSLLVHQILLTIAAHDGKLRFETMVISALLSLLIAGLLFQMGVSVSPSLLIVLVGHPLAIAVVSVVGSTHTINHSWAMRMGRQPLTIYGAHLVLLTLAHAAFA